MLADKAVIPIERTQVPVEWDDLRNSITHIVGGLGPTKEQKKGPSAISSNPLPTGWPARASRSTPH